VDASTDRTQQPTDNAELSLRLPDGFQFECPLCRAHSFGLAMRTVPWSDSAIYKCGGCHFHFSDPAQYPKTPLAGPQLQPAGSAAA
jgi:predicted CxxxxCH...CXXCH cytochrome family protein